MLHGEALGWLAARGGTLTTRARDGVWEVVASAHNLAAHVPVKDRSDADQMRLYELEAIWQLKQLIED